MEDRSPPEQAEELLDRYRAGERDFRGARLRGARLADADLVEADLENADLEGADLEGARLVGSKFKNANLRGANLKNAQPVAANFRNADLREANLEGAQMLDAHLKNANLKEANLERARLIGARLLPADDPDELFDGNNERCFRGVNLASANLRETDFLGAELWGADLKNAYLRKANLYDANLWKADLRNAVLLGTNLTAAKIMDANLRGATLMGATLDCSYLTFADLAHANLWGANIRMAMLQRANFWGANLERADLEGAELEEANLAGAKLSGANLRQAKLVGANLERADLNGAIIDGAELQGAIFGATSLGLIDLSRISDIETLRGIRHLGPSSVGIETLLACGGKIPQEFLLGCGLSDWEIELARLFDPALSRDVLLTIARRLHELRDRGADGRLATFIVHHGEDSAFASLLHDALQKRGVRCWLDHRQGLPEDQPFGFIDRIIRRWDRVVFCASRSTLAGSAWIDEEILAAVNREKAIREQEGGNTRVLIPVDLDGCLSVDRGESAVRQELRGRLIVDFSAYRRGDARLDPQPVERLVDVLYAQDPEAINSRAGPVRKAMP